MIYEIKQKIQKKVDNQYVGFVIRQIIRKLICFIY